MRSNTVSRQDIGRIERRTSADSIGSTITIVALIVILLLLIIVFKT
jgi:hypothetical protein